MSEPEMEELAIDTPIEEMPESVLDTIDLITVQVPTTVPSFSVSKNVGVPTGVEGLVAGSATSKPSRAKGPSLGPGGKIKMGSLFGSRNLGSGALTGYLYDFKQTCDKEAIPYNRKDYARILHGFLDKGRKESALKEYFKTKEPLSITQFVIPKMSANEAPKAFDVEKDVKPMGWMVHYKGQVSPPYSGTFRFAGHADDVMLVMINNEVVFNGSWSANYYNGKDNVRETVAPKGIAGNPLLGGKWINMHADSTYDMEVILGEVPGGSFHAFLLVQDKRKDYETHPDGYPILPVFQIMPTEIPEYQENKGIQVAKHGLVFGVQ